MSTRSERAFSITEIGPLQISRHVVQLITFIFLNGKLFGLASTGVIVPYLWSSGSPWSTAIGAYDALEYTITHSIFPLLALGIIYLTAVTVGRLFCGWACPVGLLQDLLSYLPFKKEKLSNSTLSTLKDIKWAVLGFFLLTSVLVGFRRAGPDPSTHTRDPVGVFSDSPFAVFSPSGTLFAYLPWLLLWNTNAIAQAGLVGWLKLVLLMGVLVPSVYVPRFFCRFLCPLGALLEPLAPYKILRIRKSAPTEEFNKTLSDVCPMGVQLGDTDYIDHSGCINCGKCMTEYPKHTSLELNYS